MLRSVPVPSLVEMARSKPERSQFSITPSDSCYQALLVSCLLLNPQLLSPRFLSFVISSLQSVWPVVSASDCSSDPDPPSRRLRACYLQRSRLLASSPRPHSLLLAAYFLAVLTCSMSSPSGVKYHHGQFETAKAYYRPRRSFSTCLFMSLSPVARENRWRKFLPIDLRRSRCLADHDARQLLRLHG